MTRQVLTLGFFCASYRYHYLLVIGPITIKAIFPEKCLTADVGSYIIYCDKALSHLKEFREGEGDSSQVTKRLVDGAMHQVSL